jgi:hypothetical protein
MTRRTLAFAGLWAASLAAIYLVTRPGEAVAPPPVATAPTAPAAAPVSGTRTVVIERAARPRAAAPPAALDPQPDAVVEAVDHDAYLRADATLSAGMADGRWTEEDRRAFIGSLAELDGEQVDSLLSVLIPAINDGELELETRGAL